MSSIQEADSDSQSKEFQYHGLNDAIHQTRKLTTLYFVVLVYGVFTLSGLTDLQILKDQLIRLPIVGIDVPLSGFFFASPVLLLGLFVHLQVHLQRLGRLIREFLRGNEARPSWLYVSMSTIEADAEPGLFGKMQVGYARLLLWGSLPMGLLGISVSAARIHNPVLSPFTTIMFLVGLVISFGAWLRYEQRSLLRFFAPGFLVLLISSTFFLSWMHAAAFQGTILNLNLEGKDVASIIKSAPEYTGQLEGRKLQGAQLQSSNLAKIVLRNTDLSRSKAEYADFRGTDLRGAELSRSDLMFADLREARLSRSNLEKANLSFSNVAGADFSKAQMAKVDLSGADGLHRANLTQVFMRDGIISGTNLDSVDLTRSNLDGADLSGAKLRKAVLRFTSLRGADLRGVDLSKADLTGADLRDVVGLTQEHLCNVVSLTGALPESLQVRANRTCLSSED